MLLIYAVATGWSLDILGSNCCSLRSVGLSFEQKKTFRKRFESTLTRILCWSIKASEFPKLAFLDRTRCVERVRTIASPHCLRRRRKGDAGWVGFYTPWDEIGSLLGLGPQWNHIESTIVSMMFDVLMLGATCTCSSQKDVCHLCSTLLILNSWVSWVSGFGICYSSNPSHCYPQVRRPHHCPTCWALQAQDLWAWVGGLGSARHHSAG